MAELTPSPHPSSTIQPRPSIGFDDVHHRGFKIAKGVRIRPMHILSICWRTASPASKCVNLPLATCSNSYRTPIHTPK
ncbi:hypothetical protein N431DRAFT_435346 [Stipitochalara longipes BDJ]|nr:hypothetical protein N431DRAFT_435346 [Stipitochalara longipes BDJ]